MSAELPDPLAGIEIDLHDFESMPLDVVRLRDSDLAVVATAEEFRAAVLLWCAAWHQIPAGSVPSDERVLAGLAGFGRDVAGWRAVAEGAMRGFVKCSDGRLYHPVVVEKALIAFDKRKKQSTRTAAATAARLAKQRDDDVTLPKKPTSRSPREGNGREDSFGSDEPKAAGAASPPPKGDLQKQVYDLGKQLLGSGGQVTKLIKAHNDDLTATLFTLNRAEGRSDPSEYCAAIIHRQAEPETDWDAKYREMGVDLD
jgi:hypothetical protein